MITLAGIKLRVELAFKGRSDHDRSQTIVTIKTRSPGELLSFTPKCRLVEGQGKTAKRIVLFNYLSKTAAL